MDFYWCPFFAMFLPDEALSEGSRRLRQGRSPPLSVPVPWWIWRRSGWRELDLSSLLQKRHSLYHRLEILRTEKKRIKEKSQTYKKESLAFVGCQRWVLLMPGRHDVRVKLVFIKLVFIFSERALLLYDSRCYSRPQLIRADCVSL